MTDIVFRHVQIEHDRRRRAILWNRGAGTVIARVELAGTVTGYDLELDDCDGAVVRATPGELRFVTIPAPAAPAAQADIARSPAVVTTSAETSA